MHIQAVNMTIPAGEQRREPCYGTHLYCVSASHDDFELSVDGSGFNHFHANLGLRVDSPTEAGREFSIRNNGTTELEISFYVTDYQVVDNRINFGDSITTEPATKPEMDVGYTVGLADYEEVLIHSSSTETAEYIIKNIGTRKCFVSRVGVGGVGAGGYQLDPSEKLIVQSTGNHIRVETNGPVGGGGTAVTVLKSKFM